VISFSSIYNILLSKELALCKNVLDRIIFLNKNTETENVIGNAEIKKSQIM